MDDYKIIMLVDDDHLNVKLDSVSIVGTDDYNQLTNIPKINNVEVKGSKALIGNVSNPHGVTKAQVGLGNVANYNQSKAIKSITRSGTTFTATALDGTTFTFTQQDNNTTYGVATQNANGLMSSADKTKLDSLSATSVSAISNSEIDSIVAS